MTWCWMNGCWREAAAGSRFCAMHGWNQPQPDLPTEPPIDLNDSEESE